jgi:membrane protein YqaA with SNARE-associated domain
MLVVSFLGAILSFSPSESAFLTLLSSGECSEDVFRRLLLAVS